MPRQNRVTPFGEIVADPERGAFMGNRGVLLDPHGHLTRRRWSTPAWIICVLEFKGRRIPVAAPGHNTQLFFLDEATALAAGHRPCGECRRADFDRFKSLWLDANPRLINVGGVPRSIGQRARGDAPAVLLCDAGGDAPASPRSNGSAGVAEVGDRGESGV